MKSLHIIVLKLEILLVRASFIGRHQAEIVPFRSVVGRA